MIDITLLTQADCGLCAHAKQVLRRVGEDFPIRVEEIDLATQRGVALAAEAGMVFAPGLLVAGEPFGHGRISERKLRRTLERLPQTRKA